MWHLFAQEVPAENFTFLDVIIWPLTLSLLGGVIFYGGWWVENRLKKSPWKWIAIVPVAWALYIGFGYMTKYRDPFYQATLVGGGKKMMAAHYAAFIIPVLALIGILLFHFFNHKLNLDTDD